MVIGAERARTGNWKWTYVMYHVEYMYMWFMSRPQGRAQGLTPKGKLFMGSSMWVGVVGVWLHHHKVLIIHLLYIQTSPFIRNQVFLLLT